MSDSNNMNDEIAAAEAALKEAQERLRVAREKQAPGGQPEEPSEDGGADQPGGAGQSNQQGHDAWSQAYQPYGQPYQQPYAQAAPNTKDHVAAGLLAIFLGSLGIHKFYLGYNTPGFIMLAVTIVGSIFSLGLAGLAMVVISIVEGVLYLSKSQTEFEQIYVFNKKEWF